ncbi:flavin-containing monooxygenase [Gordonia humi]
MQFVPAASETADRVTVFQRTPQWAMPHPLKGRPVDASRRFLHAHVPFYLAWYRARLFWRMGDKVWKLLQVDPDYPHLGRAVNKANDRLRAHLTAYIEHQLADRPDLLAKSLPDYPPYGKRLLIDAGWFSTLTRDTVDLVTDDIETVTPRGVRTAGGVEHEADVLVLATGFRAVDVLGSIEVTGRDGRDLHTEWGEGDGRAYLGITVPGFPNFFCLYGPNTNTGHGGTVIAGTEMQIQHVSALISMMIDRDLASVEVRRDVHDAYNAELDAAMARTVWDYGGTTTYYRNDRGRIVTNSPWRYIDYWSRVHEPNDADYIVTAKAPAPTAV